MSQKLKGGVWERGPGCAGLLPGPANKRGLCASPPCPGTRPSRRPRAGPGTLWPFSPAPTAENTAALASPVAGFFDVQGIFWQSLGGSPPAQGALGWGPSECLGLSKAVLGSPLCFNRHLSTKTSSTSFPARRRLKEPTPGPGKGKYSESSVQREAALDTKGFGSRETSPGCAGGHGSCWVDAALPEGSDPSVGHPQPCRRTASSVLGVREEAAGSPPAPAAGGR